MNRSEHLFHLIKSLTRSEKRYFKIFASRHTIGEKNNYLAIFELIDKQAEYDEAAILKKLKGVNPKTFSSVKVHLYNLILRSLRLYNSSKNNIAQIRELLDFAEILFEKGLYSQCRKALNKAKELAYKGEEHLILLKIFETEAEIHRRKFDIQDFNKFMNEEMDEQFKILEQHQTILKYRELFNNVFFLIRTKGEGIRSEEEFKDLTSSIDFSSLDNEHMLTTNKARLLFYSTKSLYAHILSDYKQAAEYSKKCVDLLENQEVLSSSEAQLYYLELNNQYVALRLQKKYDEIPPLLNKLKEIPHKSTNMEILAFQQYYLNLLDLYTSTGEIEKGATLIPEVEEGLEQYESKLEVTPEVIIYANIAMIYFFQGEYKKAMLWNNKILSNKRFYIREDFICFHRIFELLILFEMGDWDVLDYAILSTNRFLAKAQREYKMETLITSYIKKLSKTTDRNQQHDLYVEFKQDLIKLKNDPFQNGSLEYFDIISLVDSKIEGRSFMEIVKQRAMELNMN